MVVMDRLRLNTWIVFLLCIYLKGYCCLECYVCDTERILGPGDSDCVNITNDKYLENFTVSDPPDNADVGVWTFCSLRVGQKDGRVTTSRASQWVYKFHGESYCVDNEDWDGPYTTCYCRSDKCNGRSVDDFRNSSESTTGLPTTKITTTTAPSTTSSGGRKGLKCYSCFSNPKTELPDVGCNNITDDTYLEDYPVVDPSDNEEVGVWSYCVVTMGTKDGNPWSQRTETLLFDSHSDGRCEEGENWMGKYKTCYCRSDKCNGASVDEFENIGESTTGLPTTKMTSTTIKQTTSSNGERKELTCYECDTHPVLPTFNPPQPECESNPKEEFIKDVPYYDFGGLKTFCSVQVTLEGNEKRTRRSFSLLDMDADGRCDFETNEQGQMTQKICYCRSDACNVQNVTLEHENGPSTTSASPSTGATSVISESTQAVITTGSTRGTTPTSKTTSKDDESSGGENGSWYHSSRLLDYQVTMLMVHFTLVIVSASFAAYSVYVVAKHRRTFMESLSYSSVQPCDKKILSA